jgi:hypothetical protein
MKKSKCYKLGPKSWSSIVFLSQERLSNPVLLEKWVAGTLASQ